MSENDDQWTEVWSSSWLHEAQFFKSILEANAMDVFLPDEHTLGVDPGLAPAFGGVRILVRGRDVAQAREIIELAATHNADPEQH